MAVYPVRLDRLSDNQLLIEWSDGQQRRYSARELRDQCPCATCREKLEVVEDAPKTVLPIITEAEAQPLVIQSMKPVGNYAYSIGFSDGHDTGIYTLEFLREAGREAE
jgi:DUF971 family protein